MKAFTFLTKRQISFQNKSFFYQMDVRIVLPIVRYRLSIILSDNNYLSDK